MNQLIRNSILATFGAPPAEEEAAAGYTISESLRFNSADSAYLSWTPPQLGNQRIWTWSGWVKRSALGATQVLFYSDGTSNTTYFWFGFNSSDQLSSGYWTSVLHTTTQVFRDVSSWYHIVVAVDTTQATATDRLKFYVNGELITQISSNAISLNQQLGINNTIQHNICRDAYSGGRNYVNGYLAEVHFVDGQALTPSDFGEYDTTTGVWKPKEYTGSYGANGFYLPFNDNSSVSNLGLSKIAYTSDQGWNRTSLLLNPNGTNAGFSDSSNNNFAITVNGDAYVDSTSPFMVDEGNWSLYQAAVSADYLNFGSGDWTFSGDFTIDAWVYYTSASSGDTSLYVSSVSGYFAFNISMTAGLFNIYLNSGSPTTTISHGISANTWTHVAMVRSGSTITLYTNGVAKGTITSSATLGFNNPTINRCGGGVAGVERYISNLRILRGTAIDFSTVGVPTSPVSDSTTNQILLTAYGNRFVDFNTATTAKTITVTGSPKIQPLNPFTTEYNQVYGSGYFDGSGDYLTAADNVAFEPGSGDFYVACWVYHTTTASGITIYITQTSGGISFYRNASGKLEWGQDAVAAQLTSTNNVPINAWTHVAASRVGSTVKLWINGVEEASGTLTTSYAGSGTVNIGGSSSGYYHTGHIFGLQLLKGSGVSSVTVPTSPPTSDANTSLLTCKYQNPVRNIGFIDSGPYDHQITRNGNTTQGRFSPFAEGWSNNLASKANFTFTGTAAFSLDGDFTWECWVYLNSYVGSSYNELSIFNNRSGSSTGTQIDIGNTATNPGGFGLWHNGSTIASAGAGIVPLNQWVHLAQVRQGSSTNNIKLYVNGIQVAQGTSTATLFGSSGTFYIGYSIYDQPFNNIISNLRLTKGGALYTSNFTPPTAPLTTTVASGTVSLLTCQSNRFVDNSASPVTLTVNTSPKVTAFNPFTPTQDYSASINGGSMYQVGATDYVQSASSSSVSAWSTDFTIECWIYPTALSGTNCIWTNSTSHSDGMTAGYTRDGRICLGRFGINETTSATGLITNNTWHHVAWVRSGSSLNIYLNGVSVATPTTSNIETTTTKPMTVGGEFQTGDTSFPGYISGFRVLKGTAIDYSSVGIPTAPPTNIANTSLLLNFTNAGIVDSSGKNDIETVGNAQVDTAVTKWGSSMKFDGTGDYLIAPATNNYLFNSGSFTIEGWFNPNTVSPANQYMVAVWGAVGSSDTNSAWQVRLETNNIKAYIVNGTSVTGVGGGGSISTGQWYHFAFVRNGNSLYLFLNGTQVGSTVSYTLAMNSPSSSFFTVGMQLPSGNSPYNGYLEDLRITKGLARYTGNFTVPDAPFAYDKSDINYKQWQPNNFSVETGPAYSQMPYTGSYNAGANLTHLFDSDTTNICKAAINTTATWTARNAIPFTKLEILGSTETSGTFSVNGVDVRSLFPGYPTYSTIDLTNVSGIGTTLQSIAISSASNDYGAGILKAVYINGTQLVDSFPQNNDSLVDTPTPYGTDTGAGGEVRGNYCTLNPLSTALTGLNNGNLNSGTSGAANWKHCRSTFALDSGKWYWECLVSAATDASNGYQTGVLTASASLTGDPNSASTGFYTRQNTNKYANGTRTDPYFTSTTSNDVLMFAFDADTGKMWNGKNGTWEVSGNPAAGTNENWSGVPAGVFPMAGSYGSSINITANFGQRPFAYTAPTGFKALCTQNLPTPTVVQGNDYFNTVLYTGNGSTQSITGVGFQPDFVWIKYRNQAYNHDLFDSIRGVSKYIRSNTTQAELSYPGYGVTAFNSDGFSVTDNSAGDYEVNGTSGSLVAWNWNAGGSNATNTDGDVTTTVRANQTAGFSIITYTGNGATECGIGHGLNAIPKFVVIKNRSSSSGGWLVRTTIVDGSHDLLYLNTTAAKTNSARSLPTTTEFFVGSGADDGASGNNFVAYAFAEIEGYSKFGSYTGNGSADGPFVYCGFRPAFVIRKVVSGTTNQWVLMDTARDTYNLTTKSLYPNLSNAEETTYNHMDILSNGFKMRTADSSVNGNGYTYIFMAFAENPFKYSLAR